MAGRAFFTIDRLASGQVSGCQARQLHRPQLARPCQYYDSYGIARKDSKKAIFGLGRPAELARICAAEGMPVLRIAFGP
jgi:hypothetical protein